MFKQSFRASATSFNANTENFSPKSKVLQITSHGEFEDGTLWIRCNDGKFRHCKTNRVSNQNEVALLVAAIEFAHEHKLPVILRAKGNNSTDHWFCEVTFITVGKELSRLCPLKATGTRFLSFEEEMDYRYAHGLSLD